MNQLNSRMQLALFNRKKECNTLEKGFTLVELLIVVVVLGVLSGVALPNFLGASERAKRNSSMTSTVEMSKECSSEILLDEGRTGYTYTAYNSNDLVDVLTACSDNTTIGGKFETAVNQDAIPNTLCVADPATSSKFTTCTITVGPSGERSGVWS